MSVGNDITGGADVLSQLPKFRKKAITGKGAVWTHVGVPEILPLDAVEDSAAVPLTGWLTLPGIEEAPL